MNDKIIGFVFLVCFLLGALVVFGIESAIQRRKKRKQAELNRRKAEYIKYFKRDIVPFKGTPSKEAAQ